MELSGIVGDNPINEEELNKVKQNKSQQLAGRWETLSAVKRELRQVVAFDLPDSHYNTISERLDALTLDEVRNAAADIIRTQGLVWFVVGDLDKIEDGIDELGLGVKQVVDGDGNPVH
jgi:zinc protease